MYTMNSPSVQTLLQRVMMRSTIGRMVLTGQIEQTGMISVEESVRLARAERQVEPELVNRSMRMNAVLDDDLC